MSQSKKKPLTEVISMRLSEHDVELLDKVSKFTPYMPRLSLARWALKIGLATMKDEKTAREALERASKGER
jgi:hypothetical protein